MINSPEAYFQEAGRGGRDGLRSYALLLWKKQLLHRICSWVLRALTKLHLLRNPERKQERLDQVMNNYGQVTQMIKGKRRLLLKGLLLNTAHRACQIFVTVLCFLAGGGSPRQVPDVFAMQCSVVIGAYCIPIPGSMGVTDYLMIDGFSSLMDEGQSANLELLSRGLSFYVCILLCGLIVLTKYLIIRFRRETIDYAKQLVANSRYRTACVVDNDMKFLGMISRNSFLDTVYKQVILLDHNEYAQAVDGIEKAEILEIIDHHRLGAITTLKPIGFLNEPVGSTSTIIAGKFAEAGIVPDKATAGILLSGILSDTMVLRLSTTTDKDRRIVKNLAEIAGVDVDEYGTELIRKGMDLEGIPMESLLMRDVKEYNLFGKKVIISQVLIPTFEFSADNRDEIKKAVASLKKSNSADIFAALLTSVFENGSELYIAADAAVLTDCGMTEQPIRKEGMMSRKNDFIPWFGEILRNLP